MIAMALFRLALSDTPVTLAALRLEAENDRPVVRAVVSRPVLARVERDGRELLLILPGAHAVAGLAVPEPVAEIQSLVLEDTREGTRIRIRLDQPHAYDLHQDGGVVSLSLRPGPLAPVRRPPSDIQDLYAKIVPPAGEAPASQNPPAGEAPADRGGEPDGLTFGFVRLRPSLVASYIDASTAFLDTPQPVEDRYFQIEPRLVLGVGGDPGTGPGRFQLTYGPRFRTHTHFAQLRHATHLVTASVDLPIGSSLTVRASHHYAHGLLETTEVDPGREYFFHLAPFTHHQTAAGAILNSGGRLGLDVNASRDSVHVDDQSAFFDYRIDTLAANLIYQLGPDSRSYLRYEYDRVPTPAERPIVESRGSTLSVGVAGAIIPLVTGDLSVGYRRLDAPRAGAGGTRFRGTTLAATLRKEFTPSAALALVGHRGTYPSAFEDNAFYVATSLGVETDLGLPLSLAFHGGLGWQRNDYRVAATGGSGPRRDRLVGWSVGVGRSLTRWSFLRADYRTDRRTSDLAAFATSSHAFTLQLGLGYLGLAPSGVAPR